MSGARDWGVYWDGPDGGATASLANLPAPLQAILDRPWQDLAQRLPPRGRLLDLATGGGLVPLQLRALRPDLKLTGVDAAPKLPKRPGIDLRGGVDIAALPLPDAHFHAVTSRFGIEYSVGRAAAIEAARVLRCGGELVLVLHHVESPILGHNRARHDALEWALGSGWIEKALNYAAARRLAALPVPAGFRAAPKEAARRFPDQSAAWEFLTGLVQVLDHFGAVPGSALSEAIAGLKARADGEIGRLATLGKAARTGKDISDLIETLRAGAIELARPTTLDDPHGAPLAWLVLGTKQ